MGTTAQKKRVGDKRKSNRRKPVEIQILLSSEDVQEAITDGKHNIGMYYEDGISYYIYRPKKLFPDEYFTRVLENYKKVLLKDDLSIPDAKEISERIDIFETLAKLDEEDTTVCDVSSFHLLFPSFSKSYPVLRSRKSIV